MTAEAPVQRQLEAYKARDLARFVAAVVYDVVDGLIRSVWFFETT